jgi:hypothetical protein
VRGGEGREPGSAHGQRIRPPARVGEQHAPRDLGRGLVVRRRRAGGGIDTVHDGLEHGENLRGARFSAIHQKDDY